MSRQRRYLPSISLLSAFEAVLLTGSTAAASRQLQLSQGAVSRLVQSLEAQLGRVLFIRERKRLIPTEAAIAYGRDVTAALNLIQRSSTHFSANLGGGTLALAILPAFGTRWLAPRLGRFLAANPGVTINLSTRIRPFDFAQENFDAAIYFGDGAWPEAGHLKLFDEQLTACAAPALVAERRLKTAADLRDLQLLQIETRPSAWDVWFRGQGTSAPPVNGMIFDQFAPIVEAAIAGLGVALLPDYLAAPEISAGRLVPLFRPSVAGTGAYWLAWPQSRHDYQPLAAFRSWLGREAADT